MKAKLHAIALIVLVLLLIGSFCILIMFDYVNATNGHLIKVLKRVPHPKVKHWVINSDSNVQMQGINKINDIKPIDMQVQKILYGYENNKFYPDNCVKKLDVKLIACLGTNSNAQRQYIGKLYSDRDAGS